MTDTFELTAAPFTLDRYLSHSDHKKLHQHGNLSIVQLKNLKVLQIEETDLATYRIEEITVGSQKRQNYGSGLNLDDLIQKIIKLAGGKDTYFVTWCVEDVLTLDAGAKLTPTQARLVLQMAIDSHDANVGVNWSTITKQCRNVSAMIKDGIIN